MNTNDLKIRSEYIKPSVMVVTLCTEEPLLGISGVSGTSGITGVDVSDSEIYPEEEGL